MLTDQEAAAAKLQIAEIDRRGEEVGVELEELEWSIDTGALAGQELEEAENRLDELNAEFTQLYRQRCSVAGPLKAASAEREIAYRRSRLSAASPPRSSTRRVEKHRRSLRGAVAGLSRLGGRG